MKMIMDVTEEAMTTRVAPDSNEEELRQLLEEYSSRQEAPTVRCFGTGSRIIMEQFRTPFINSINIYPGDHPLSVYTAFFGRGVTHTHQSDLSLLIDEKVLLRFRLKNKKAKGFCEYEYDPESILELYVNLSEQ